jgi:hypothetical protein
MADFHESVLQGASTNFKNASWRGANIEGIENKTGAVLPGKFALRAKSPGREGQGFFQSLLGLFFKTKKQDIEKVKPTVVENNEEHTPIEQRNARPEENSIYTQKLEQNKAQDSERVR